VLTDDTAAGQYAILFLLLLGQVASSWFLLGGLAITVQFLEPLIAAVR
jgi:hypothetical protein